MKLQNSRKFLARPAYRRTARLLQAAAFFAFSRQVAHATTFNWDPGLTNSAAGGGAGNWDLSSSNWFNNTASTANKDQVWPDGSTSTAMDTAVFGGAAGTGEVDTTAAIGVNTIQFNTANYSILNATGGTLTLVGATPTINVNNTGSDDIGAPLLGGTGFTKTGAGTLTLSSSQGILALDKGNSINVTAGTLTIRNIVSGGTAGSTVINVTGSGNLSALNGANTFSGVANLGASSLSPTTNYTTFLGATGADNGTIIGNGGNIRYQNASTQTIDEQFTINGGGNGAGALSFYNGGGNTLAGAITLGSDASIGVRPAGSGRTNTISGGITEGGTSSNMTFFRYNDVTSTGSSLDTFVLTTAASTYKGNTTITDAFTTTTTKYFSVQSSLNDALPTSTVLVLGGLSSVQGATLGAAAGAGRFVLNGVNQTVAGLTTGNTNALNIVAGGSATLSTLTVNNAANYTFSGVLGAATTNGNNLALVKAGAGTLTLTGANTYTGGTTINGGTMTLTGAISGTPTVRINNAGTLLLGADNRINDSATVTLDGGTLNLGSKSEGAAGASGVGALTLTSTSTLDFGPAGNSNLIQFTGLGTHTAGTRLQVTDWEGTVGGANGTDRLLFAGSSSSFGSLYLQSDVSFNGGLGYGVKDFGSYFEVFGITAVPEPSTWAAGLLMLGALGYSQRRQVRCWLGSARLE